MNEAHAKLHSAAQAISTAALILKMEMETMEAFQKEARDMENFGHIVDPTLYRDSERRAAAAVVGPLFDLAVSFVKKYDEHIARSKAALQKVSDHQS